MTVVPVPTTIDHDAVLRSLRLNPNDPDTQALLLICQRYGLDPLLKHVVLIQGRPYVTRDGYLHIAHVSGQLDGIEILDEGVDGEHWWAKVAVYRKDMSRPFTYRGRYVKQGAGNRQYGPEMAVKCAEVAALRRAFNVTGAGAADERWDSDETAAQPVESGPVLPTPEELGFESREHLTHEHENVKELAADLSDEQRASLTAWRGEAGIAGWPLPKAELDRVWQKIVDLSTVDNAEVVPDGEEPF